VEIPERMQHAIARQAEAERERRAKIINAEGEAQAAAKLAEAADVIGRNPVTLQLRYLQTLREIGGGQNSTIVFPVDVVRPIVQALGAGAPSAAAADPASAPQTPGTEALDALVAQQIEAARRGQLGPGAPSGDTEVNGAPSAERESEPAPPRDDSPAGA
jgi:hypothetical protein